MEIANIKSLILFIIAFLNSALGLLVFFKNRKEKINTYYALTAWTTAAWSFSLAIFWSTSNINLALVSYQFAYVFAALIGASFLAFSFVFPFALAKLKSIYKILFYTFTGFVVVFSIWPDILIKGVNLIERRPILSDPYHYIYVTYFTMCMIGAFGNFILKYERADEIQKIQIKYVFLGTLLAAIWGTTASLYLPLFKIYRFMTFGPYFTVVMVGLIAYAILKYHLMNIKVILTDFLVGIMGVILLMLPFLMPNNLLRILSGVIFILFSIFGYYLIKATYREAQQKEEAQRLAAHETTEKEEALWMAKTLKEFNEALEMRVKEKTKEFREAKTAAEQKAKEAEQRKEELEKFYKLTVGREIKMGELKEKIKELEEKLKNT